MTTFEIVIDFWRRLWIKTFCTIPHLQIIGHFFSKKLFVMLAKSLEDSQKNIVLDAIFTIIENSAIACFKLSVIVKHLKCVHHIILDRSRLRFYIAGSLGVRGCRGMTDFKWSVCSLEFTDAQQQRSNSEGVDSRTLSRSNFDFEKKHSCTEVLFESVLIVFSNLFGFQWSTQASVQSIDKPWPSNTSLYWRIGRDTGLHWRNMKHKNV